MPLNRYHAHTAEELVQAYMNACFALCHKDTKTNQNRLNNVEAELLRRLKKAETADR